MDPVGAVIIFVISWWLSFFCVLPIGVRRQDETNISSASGIDMGAPAEPMIGKKALWALYGAIGLTSVIMLVSRLWLR